MCVWGNKSEAALPALTGPGQKTRVCPAEERSAAAAPWGRRPSGPRGSRRPSRRTGWLQPPLRISCGSSQAKRPPLAFALPAAHSLSAGKGLCSRHSPQPGSAPRLAPSSFPVPGLPRPRSDPSARRCPPAAQGASRLGTSLTRPPYPREGVSSPPSLSHRLLSSQLFFFFPPPSARNCIPADVSRPFGPTTFPLCFLPINKPSLWPGSIRTHKFLASRVPSWLPTATATAPGTPGSQPSPAHHCRWLP